MERSLNASAVDCIFMQISRLYAIYTHYFCINMQFTAYNASSVYQVYYAEDYEGYIGAAWTATVGRYSVSMDNGYAYSYYTKENNNDLLTSPSLNVATGVDYIMNFDLQLTPTNQNPSGFAIGANSTNVYKNHTSKNANANAALLLEQQAASTGTWLINGSTTQSVSLTAGTWYTFTLKRITEGGTVKMRLSIVQRDDSDATPAFEEADITTLNETGGLGCIQHYTQKSYATMGIDNIVVYTK